MNDNFRRNVRAWSSVDLSLVFGVDNWLFCPGLKVGAGIAKATLAKYTMEGERRKSTPQTTRYMARPGRVHMILMRESFNSEFGYSARHSICALEIAVRKGWCEVGHLSIVSLD